MLADRRAARDGLAEMVKKENHEPTTLLYLNELLQNDDAIPLLKRAVQRYADDPRLFTVLVFRLLVAQPLRAVEAISYSRAAFALQPRNSYSCVMVAVSLRRAQAWDDSISQARRAIELDNDNAQAYVSLGLAQASKGDFDAGMQSLQKANRKNAISSLALANVCANYGHWDEALGYCEQAIKLDGKNRDAYALRGGLLCQQGKLAAAEAALNKAIKLDPKNAQNYAVLGLVLAQQGHAERAIAELETAVKFDANSSYAHNVYGQVLVNKNDLINAIDHFKRAIKANPTYESAHNNLAIALQRMKDSKSAIAILYRASSQAPQAGVAQYNLGVAQGRIGDWNAAAAALKRATELAPQNSQFQAGLAYVYWEKRDWDEFIAEQNKAIELAPGHAQLYCDRGIALHWKGKLDEAVASLQRGITPAPNGVNPLSPAQATRAHSNLGNVLRSKGDLDGAIAEFRESIKLDPKNAAALYNLGDTLHDAGRLADAEAALESPLLANKGTALQDVKTALHLQPDLAAIAEGTERPKDATELRSFARLCQVTKHYRAAVDLYETLAKPENAKKYEAPRDHLDLARLCLRAADGQGSNPPPPEKRPEYRSKALKWLRKYLEAHEERLKKNHNGYRYQLQADVRSLYYHQDLVAVWPSALDRLPEAERQEWRAFWDDVRRLLEQADVPVIVIQLPA